MPRSGDASDTPMPHPVRSPPLLIAPHVEDPRVASDLAYDVAGARYEPWIDAHLKRPRSHDRDVRTHGPARVAIRVEATVEDAHVAMSVICEEPPRASGEHAVVCDDHDRGIRDAERADRGLRVVWRHDVEWPLRILEGGVRVHGAGNVPFGVVLRRPRIHDAHVWVGVVRHEPFRRREELSHGRQPYRALRPTER